jgi:hypothetical protein
MWDDAEHFRKRAQECRRLAEHAKEADRLVLLDIAAELDEEAKVIEAEQCAER